MAKRETVGADEVDAFAGRRDAHTWKAGQRKRIKAGANRRDRRAVKRNARDFRHDHEAREFAG